MTTSNEIVLLWNSIKNFSKQVYKENDKLVVEFDSYDIYVKKYKHVLEKAKELGITSRIAFYPSDERLKPGDKFINLNYKSWGILIFQKYVNKPLAFCEYNKSKGDVFSCNPTDIIKIGDITRGYEIVDLVLTVEGESYVQTRINGHGLYITLGKFMELLRAEKVPSEVIGFIRSDLVGKHGITAISYIEGQFIVDFKGDLNPHNYVDNIIRNYDFRNEIIVRQHDKTSDEVDKHVVCQNNDIKTSPFKKGSIAALLFIFGIAIEFIPIPSKTIIHEGVLEKIDKQKYVFKDGSSFILEDSMISGIIPKGCKVTLCQGIFGKYYFEVEK